MSVVNTLLPRVLIANRGEIAMRVSRSARALGCSTVSIFSEDDKDSFHRFTTDWSVPLADRGVSAYLDIEQIVSLALEHKCDGIHPGYGFLSESADFAHACEAAGIVFVGPTPETLRLLGDKTESRAKAEHLGVPVPAGTERIADLGGITAFFRSFEGRSPIVIKAVAGGGGRGMRVVRGLEELEEAFERCTSEASKAFGNADLYAEEFIESARHVEIQVVGDGQGNIAHLWDRECTLQRRHQKLLEIAPSPWISGETREALLDYSTRIAKAVQFRGVGTFEYLVNEASSVPAAFIEANPRLQVEHTVTEEVLGVDLVALQLRIAAGASLPECGLQQGQVGQPVGCAIRLRINAERMDETGSILPAAGVVSGLNLPVGPGLRVDHALYDGYEHKPLFDPIVAKLIFHSHEGYDAARQRAIQGLDSFVVDGLHTNAMFLKALCSREEVARGDISTQFVESRLESIVADAARLISPVENANSGTMETVPLPRETLPDLENGEWITAPMSGVVVSVNVEMDSRVESGQTVCVMESMKMEHAVRARMNGKVVEVCVQTGDYVEEGDALLQIHLSETSDRPTAVQELRSAGYDPNEWETLLAEITRRSKLQRENSDGEVVVDRRDSPNHTVWERVQLLADPDSFDEILPFVSRTHYENGSLKSLAPKAFVAGSCTIEGRTIMVHADDYSARGGTNIWEFAFNRMGREQTAAKLALHWQTPYVRLVHGFGGGPDIFERIGRSYLPDGHAVGAETDVALLDAVPVVSVMLGVAAGYPAVQVCLSHFSVMVKKASQMFPGGPPVVKAAFGLEVTKEELGGYQLHTQVSGGIDNAADSEKEAIEQCRRFLSYLPSNRNELPPVLDESDPIDRPQEELLAIVPPATDGPYDMLDVLNVLFDTGSVFEIAPHYGRGRITAFGRVGGLPVGILANNPFYGGATGV